MAESSAINKSLSVLGQVVHALNQGAVSYLPSILHESPETKGIPLFSRVSHTAILNLRESSKMHLEEMPLAFSSATSPRVPSSGKTLSTL
jgi:hypothetical protein